MPAKAPIVFFGTPGFSLPYLRVLSELADVRAVVCQPDKPVGRGRRVSSPPTKQLAEELELPVMQPSSLRDASFVEWLSAEEPVLNFVVAYGKLLPKDVLDLPKRGSVNAHASLLPRWRGASPIAQAILAGDENTGVCLMQMDEGMDTGPVLARSELRIDSRDTSETLSERLASLGAELLRDRFDALLSGKLEARAQDDDGATKAPLLRKEDGRLRLEEDAESCARRVRAMHPWPGAFLEGAFLEKGGMRLRVHRALAVPSHDELSPGDIVPSKKGQLLLRCGQGALRLEEVQLAGGKAMPIEAFMAGQGRKLFATSDSAKGHSRRGLGVMDS